MSTLSLCSSKVVYIFLDTSDIWSQRAFFEDVLQMAVIENDFHPPHHRHGVVKYDGGNTIFALNIGDSGFESASSDRIVTLLAGSPVREAEIYAELQIHGYAAPLELGGVFSDRDNHQFAIHRGSLSEGLSDIAVDELHLEVNDLQQSMCFYGDQLGLELLQKNASSLVFTSDNLKLVLHNKPCGRLAEPRRGFLTVFHTPDILKTYYALHDRGVQFRARVRFSEIGGTARFVDPSGHVYCLYQPSEECLTWGSGPKLMEIIGTGKTHCSNETVH